MGVAGAGAGDEFVVLSRQRAAIPVAHARRVPQSCLIRQSHWHLCARQAKSEKTPPARK
jgi:hypothetical protein